VSAHANRYHRRSIRLSGDNYTTPNAYFITIVTYHRMNLFGQIVNENIKLNKFGEIARAEWLKTANLRRQIELDEFIIMPNHMHGILLIMDVDIDPGAGASARRPGSIGAIVRAYKSAVTYQINKSRSTPGAPVWQRNYHDHILRNKYELSKIREYIRNNPIT
jgi:putative transposase